MALLPESRCSRDLASCCGEEKARPQDLWADDPRTHPGPAILVPKSKTVGKKLCFYLLPPGSGKQTTLLTSVSTSRPKNMSDEMALAPANFCRASLDSRPELRLSTSLRFVTLRGACGTTALTLPIATRQWYHYSITIPFLPEAKKSTSGLLGMLTMAPSDYGSGTQGPSLLHTEAKAQRAYVPSTR